MLIDYTDRSLHVAVMLQARLTVTGRRLAIGTRLVNSNGVSIRNLLCVYWRNVLVRPA